jgi:hypothetical protein
MLLTFMAFAPIDDLNFLAIIPRSSRDYSPATLLFLFDPYPILEMSQLFMFEWMVLLNCKR